MLEDKKQSQDQHDAPITHGPSGFPDGLFDIELPAVPAEAKEQAATVPDTDENGALIYNEWGFPAGVANLKDDRYRQVD